MEELNANARQFLEQYYSTFDTNLPALTHFYREDSMLSYQEHSRLGVVEIMEQLEKLPFEKIQHQIEEPHRDIKVQPSAENMILVFVAGLVRDGDGHPLPYSQCFTLKPDAQGNPYILNDIFHLMV